MNNFVTSEHGAKIMIGAIGAGLAAIFIAAGVSSSPVPAYVDTRWVYSTSQLQARLDGETKEEVMSFLGHPNRVASGAGPGSEIYTYDYPHVRLVNSAGGDIGEVSVLFGEDGREFDIVY
jgi:hypothetical protein